MTKKKELTTAKGGGVIVAPPTDDFDYGDMKGVGFEGITSDDLSVPFLNILQSNSPQVVDNEPEGSQPGMLYNTVTRELFTAKEGVNFIPCHVDYAFVEWVPLNKGGGFVALHDPEGEVVDEAVRNNDGQRFGKLQIGENELVETKYVYGLLLNEDSTETNGFVVISFTSTKLKPLSDWRTAMWSLKGTPPIFSIRSRLKTVKQKNDFGTFFNFQIYPGGDTWLGSRIHPVKEEALLMEAFDFRKMVIGGMAKANFARERSTGVDTAGGGDSENAPF